MADGETLAGLLAAYDDVARRTEDVVVSLDSLDAAHPLPEAPWFEAGAEWTARRALLHIIAETVPARRACRHPPRGDRRRQDDGLIVGSGLTGETGHPPGAHPGRVAPTSPTNRRRRTGPRHRCGGVDHLALAHVDPDVVDAGGAAAEEDQVPGFHR